MDNHEIGEHPLPKDQNHAENGNENPRPIPEPTPKSRWNHPRINVWRTLAAFFGLFIMGANDAAYGALIPYLETYYDLNYFLVSLIFLAPFLGYFSSASLNSYIHMTLGRRGVAFVAGGSRLVAYIIISQHPPWGVVVIAGVLAAFGEGLSDAAWNAWIGVMENANELLGILHGFFGLGATLSPLIATSMITKGGLSWYEFYYLMIGIQLVELIAAVTAFWTETAKKYQEENAQTSEKRTGHTRESLRHKVTWICSFFLLIYVGMEVAVGGWVVQFMRLIRRAAPFPAGMSATAYWVGITVGRVILGFVTPKIGEKLAILIYIALATASHLLFWLVPVFTVSTVAIAILGFFIGPLFPAAVMAAARLLPRHLHVSSIGFAAAFGSSGSCVFPFIVGAIAQSKGIRVLLPIVLILLVIDWGIWFMLPRIREERSPQPQAHNEIRMDAADLASKEEKK